MQKLSLNGEWHLTRDQEIGILAQVPGCVHLDLERAGQLIDPFYRDNESKLFWIGETNWTYERNFVVTPELLERTQVLLVCYGLDTLATLHLNGVALGKTDNMYRTWLFDVKPYLKVGENTISIRFESPMRYLRAKDAEKGVLPAWGGSHRIHSGVWLRKEPCNFGWDWGPMVVTSGIWRDIELVAFDARLTDVQIRQQHNADGSVDLNIQATTENYLAGDSPIVRVQVLREGKVIASSEQPLSGDQVTIREKIEQPELWWIREMGTQPLYDVIVQLIGQNDVVLDEQTKRIGLRTLTLERHADTWGESFQFAINGVPFFAKGANWIPADTFVPRLTHADYEKLIQASADAHMNMLRVWGGGIYEQDDFYDLCDEYGIAVWQDFMFACAAYPTFDADFMANVRAEAEDNVRHLRHHTCIALWCGNNELEQGLVADTWTETTMSWEDYGKLFDVLLPEVTERLDPDRAYWPCSPHKSVGDRNFWNNPDNGDTHLWSVWHGREPFEWYRTCFHRFVSEFGFQSFPEPATIDTFTEPEDRNITSYVMEYHQRSGIGNSTIIHYLLDWFRLPSSFESGIWISQILQGMAIKYAVEHWRRNMPRTMGTLYWQLNDCWPAPSWSSIDSLGHWKALHYMAQDFYAPLLISGLEDAAAGTVEIHITSDLPIPHDGTVEWKVTTTAGAQIDGGGFSVSTPCYQDKLVKTLDLANIIQTTGIRDMLVSLALEVDGQRVSDNLVLFARPKHLNLQPPNIQTSVQQLAPKAYQIELTAARPALWVWLSTADGQATFSDNFFHLLPDDSRLIKLTTAQEMTLDEVKQYIAIQSLRDTYAESAFVISELP
ncbi:MAG: glycoside hydrolase family 2 protein [Chloroflexota bacterium]